MGHFFLTFHANGRPPPRPRNGCKRKSFSIRSNRLPRSDSKHRCLHSCLKRVGDTIAGTFHVAFLQCPKGVHQPCLVGTFAVLRQFRKIHDVQCQPLSAVNCLLDIDTDRNSGQPAKRIRTAVAQAEMAIRIIGKPRFPSSGDSNFRKCPHIPDLIHSIPQQASRHFFAVAMTIRHSKEPHKTSQTPCRNVTDYYRREISVFLPKSIEHPAFLCLRRRRASNPPVRPQHLVLLLRRLTVWDLH